MKRKLHSVHCCNCGEISHLMITQKLSNKMSKAFAMVDSQIPYDIAYVDKYGYICSWCENYTPNNFETSDF